MLQFILSHLSIYKSSSIITNRNQSKPLPDQNKMFSLIRKSLSGEKQDPVINQNSSDEDHGELQEPVKGKRLRSGETGNEVESTCSAQKRKRLQKQQAVSSSLDNSTTEETDTVNGTAENNENSESGAAKSLPEETPA